MEAFTFTEVSGGIKKLKSNKAKGSDNIVAEMVKHAGTRIVYILTDLYNDIYGLRPLPPAPVATSELVS